MWNMMPEEARVQILEDTAKKLLLKHVADPAEIAEAYMFLMKYLSLTCAPLIVLTDYSRA